MGTHFLCVWCCLLGALSHGVSGRHYEGEEEYTDPVSAGEGKFESAQMDLWAGF